MKISKDDIEQALLLIDRMAKGLTPRNEQEAKDMEEAKALMALCESYCLAPKSSEDREDIIKAAQARVFNKQN